MNRLMLLAVMAAMALSLSSIPALQQAVHAQGIAPDTQAAAEGTVKSLEGIASDTTNAANKSAQGAVSGAKGAAQGTSKSLTDEFGKVKTDAGKTKDSAKSLDLMGTTQGAGQTKQDVDDLKNSASDMMKNPFGK